MENVLVISYKLVVPIFIVNGRPANLCSSYHESLDSVREQISQATREQGKFARVWRLTEEEIDIDKEDW